MLAVLKGWLAHRAGFGGGLMMALTRDSVLYFIVCVPPWPALALADGETASSSSTS